jgi:hypothetical protein
VTCTRGSDDLRGVREPHERRIVVADLAWWLLLGHPVRDAEVAHLHLLRCDALVVFAGDDDDVLRLHVAVDDAGIVSVSEARADL